MPTFEITSPEGTKYRVNAPEGATQEDAIAYVQSNLSSLSAQVPEESVGKSAAKGLGNAVAGFVRGAGSIGSTLLAPFDIAKDAFQGKGLSLESNRARRQGIDEGLRQLGADTESTTYQVGKLAGEIAGTAGTGGVLAKGAQAVGASPSLVSSLTSGGFNAGGRTGIAGLGTRVLGGAATGGAAAGLVNPEEAGTGAMIGGAIPFGISALKGAGGLATKAIGGYTGVGDEALTQAFKSGKQGGAIGDAFVQNMRGQVPIDDVLSSVKQNLSTMGQQKQAAYRAGMVSVKGDKSVLGFSDIDKAINDAISVATYKGQVKNPDAVSAIQKIQSQIEQWKQLNPAEFHTPEGMDALKQSISGVLESIPFEQKTARLAAGKIYDSVRSTITNQAPGYAKVMKDYSEATDIIREIEKALVGGNKATAESSLRKLQSVMRNNVNTSYGMRGDLARQLEQSGGKAIMAPLAGQALNEWTPRGIQRALTGSGGAYLLSGGQLPAAVSMAALSSPRLMGETFHALGKASRLTPPIGNLVNPALSTQIPGLLE